MHNNDCDNDREKKTMMKKGKKKNRRKKKRKHAKGGGGKKRVGRAGGWPQVKNPWRESPFRHLSD